MSEKIELVHVSRGLDKDRHLVASKLGVKIMEEVRPTKPEEKAMDLQPLPESSSDKLVCKHCSKDVIKANFDLHEIHCAKKQKETSQSKNSDKNKTDNAKNKTGSTNRPASGKKGAKQNAHKDVLSKLETVDPDDFDALIATTKEYDNKCVFPKCKVKTLTLGHTCRYCQRRFCLNHSMPEVHGCGDDVKAHARKTIIKEGMLYSGSGVPSKLPDPTRKALLEKKMDKKLTDMEAERQKKKKKK